MADATPLLVVAGPTASGKTALAVRLAKRYGGEVVSADSMQIYRGMDIATAKPTSEERDGIPHHLLDFLPPGQIFSVAEYARLARTAIQEIHGRGNLPILAGGTGLYISAVTDNIEFEPIRSDPVFREELRNTAEQRGGEFLLEQLRECDPRLANRLHPNNMGRIIRGLEVYRLTGIPLSVHQTNSKQKPAPYELCMLGLDFQDREVLYGRINRRVDRMMEAGLLDEARRFFEGAPAHTAAQAIGYKELKPYLDGNAALDEVVESLKMETRRYAKRQLTWFRRDPRIRWFKADLFQTIAELDQEVQEVLEQSGIL